LLDDVDAFVGSRSFALRFTTVTTPTTNVFMGNTALGQGSVRFGLSNTLDALNATGGALESHSPDIDLGHFVTVTATSLSEPPPPGVSVPEPTTTALLALGLLALGLLGVGAAARCRLNWKWVRVNEKRFKSNWSFYWYK
jgi:hypothetical protein